MVEAEKLPPPFLPRSEDSGFLCEHPSEFTKSEEANSCS